MEIMSQPGVLEALPLDAEQDTGHFIEEVPETESINQMRLEMLWLFGYLIGCDYFKGIPQAGKSNEAYESGRNFGYG